MKNESGNELGREVDVLLSKQTVERSAGSFAIAPRICQLAVLDQLMTRVRELDGHPMRTKKQIL